MELYISDWKSLESPVILFGGSFDPPQRAHLAMAERVLSTSEFVDGTLVFIPARQNPLKEQGPVASAEQRLQMLECAISPNLRMGISRIEIDRSGAEPSYTYTTVLAVKNALKLDRKLFFLIGSDSILQLERWHRYQDLVALLDGFIVIPRAESDIEKLIALGKRFLPDEEAKITGRILPGAIIPISATEVRERRQRGQSIDELVPMAVGQYIRSHALYKSN